MACFFGVGEVHAGEGEGGAGLGAVGGGVDDGGGGRGAGDVGGDVGEGELGALGEHDHVFDGVFELAHVAGPGVGDQGVAGFGVHAVDFFAEALHAAAQDVINQQRNIITAGAERGEFDHRAFDAEIEVFTERLVAHSLQQIAVGGGEKADIDFDGVVGAEAGDFAVLQDAEEFGLHGERHVADFVEKERAAVGVFETALAVATDVGEGAAGRGRGRVRLRGWIR